MNRIAVTAATAAATLALLTGCVGGPAAEVGPVASETTAPAGPVEDRYAAGDVLAEDEALELRRDFKHPTHTAYKLATGEWVLVHKQEPLPDNVRADVQATVDALTPFPLAAADSSGYGASGEILPAVDRIESATNRGAVLIGLAAIAPDVSATSTVDRWTATAKGWLIGHYGTRAEAVAGAEVWVAEQEIPGAFDIFVKD